MITITTQTVERDAYGVTPCIDRAAVVPFVVATATN